MSAPASLPPSAPAADNGATTRWRPLLLGGALLVAWAVVIASVLTPLALGRHFHVDEVQVAYNAALLGFHHLPAYLNFHAPFLVPLSWLTASMDAAWPALLEMRAAFFLLFLADLALVAFSAPRLAGFPARSAALLAFTLVQPFWRHGFEIRSDVLVLAGALALYALTGRAARGRLRAPGLLAAGAIAGWLQLNSFKSFLVWLPALLVLLVVAGAAGRGGRWRRGAIVLGGFVLAVGVGVALLAAAGIADDELRQLAALAGAASESRRFSVLGRLVRLARELPHLVVLAAIALGHAAFSLRAGRWRGELTSSVTAAWLVLQLLALLANPLPFSYNLIHLLPFLFLAAVDGFALLWSLWPRWRGLLALAAGVATSVAFVHSWRNDIVGRTPGTAQRAHVEAAEALTGGGDPVLDGAGLVLTRRPPGADWMLHSLTMPAYRRGERTSFRQLLAEDPAPVLLTNYRWRWLDRADALFVRDHYLAVGPRMLVLGGRREETDGRFLVQRAGRYAIAPLGDGTALRIDGVLLPGGGIRDLAAGPHRAIGAGFTWAWVGPRLGAVPDVDLLLPNRDLFISD